MKYLKTTLFLSLASLLMTGNLYGQYSSDRGIGIAENSRPVTDVVYQAPDSLDAEKIKTKQIHVAFDIIEQKDKPSGVSVLNPDEFLNTDYSSSLYDVTGRVGGLLWYNNIWGLGDALIMIDGVPRNLNDVRLEEVEQITYLKGASKAVLYGSHAANGVILITTRRGKSQEREINFRVNSGISTPKLLPEYLNAPDYMTLYNEARMNDGLSEFYDPALIENHRSGNIYRYPDLDYYSSEYLRSFVSNTNVNADISAGTENARFYANFGWINNTTLLNYGEGSREMDNRFNARGNVDLRINNSISGSLDVATIIYNSRRGLGDYWANAGTIQPNKYAPLIPIDLIHPDAEESLILAQNSKNIIDDNYLLGGTQEYLTNPIADLLAGGYNQYINRVIQITNRIDFDLSRMLSGLSFHTQFNADYHNSYNQSINNEYATYAPTWNTTGPDSIINLQKFGEDIRTGTQNISGTSQVRNLGFSMYFSYKKTFNTDHNITGLLIGKTNYISTNGIYQPETNANLGLQLVYKFKHKYWVDFSGALDNSTKLPENKRIGISPTITLSWLLSEEEFLAGSGTVDFLKFSLSGGIFNTDNEISDFYLYDGTYAPDRYFSWHDNLYLNRSTTALQGENPDLTFSKRKEIFASLEGAFLDRLIWFETTFFMTRMDGLPTQRFSQYPSYFNTFVPYVNYNADQYTGVDFMMNLNKNLGDVNLNIGLNGIYVKSNAAVRDELYSFDYLNREGKPVDAIFGLVSDGFFNDQTDIDNHPKQAFGEVVPGDIKYVDQNDDGIIDANDEVEIGKWTSPLTLFLNFSMSYKNITLFIQGSGSTGGNGVKNNDYYWVDGDDKYSIVVTDRWTEGTSSTASYPRLSSQSSTNNFRYSDFWIYGSNRFNLARMQLTYDLPARILSNSFIKGFGIFVNGSGLLTISKNKDILDLTVSGEPQMRYFTAGLRAKF
ncbi:MAG: SusC/RagA family TonB-linked outer membrane protein [Bacteroidales bacterium]|nr:SusC/RagA family TonB-linked outer membrane protein [Bacteroidales bacterium]MBN2698873.1 SusC/RagA family TonB-linked outer membrane protein [Bacteroidales bacterium]